MKIDLRLTALYWFSCSPPQNVLSLFMKRIFIFYKHSFFNLLLFLRDRYDNREGDARDGWTPLRRLLI